MTYPDLQAGQVIVFRQPVNGDYRSQQVFTQGTIPPLTLPQLAIPIPALLR